MGDRRRCDGPFEFLAGNRVNYRVTWHADILDALAEFYVQADTADQDRMAGGVEALNRQLADDPHSVGESREGEIRIAFLPLLIIRFRVDDYQRTVRVVGVGRFGR